MTGEAALRLGLFLAVLAALLVAERLAPRRLIELRSLRWPANLGIVVVDTVLVRLLIPLGAAGTALLAESRGVGLWNVVEAPGWLAVVLSVLALDLLIYWQHRIFHLVPVFWRLHRMHHSDVEFDATTALRFHPVEILLSMVIKMAAVLALGAPWIAVVAFEVILNATAMFNHSNLRLPDPLDRILRKVLVTPDMHRVHHSVHRREHDSNYGFNLSWWDHLFNSYTDQPAGGHDGMTIGLHQFRDARQQNLVSLLKQPASPL